MLLTFRDCELDSHLFTLRCGGLARPIEPLVFNLLAYLAQHRSRIVTRQELLDTLWAGKVVSESTLSSCIKAARHAVGDSGEAQNCIATIHRRGYRFVAEVQAQNHTPAQADAGAVTASTSSDLSETIKEAPRRASIAVMPFADLAPVADIRGGTASALAHDVTTRLAQLRSLFVIAQGSTIALNERHIGPQEAGQLLNVDYIVSGSVRQHGTLLTVTTLLTEARTDRIVWTEVFSSARGDAFFVLDEIGSKIVATVASEVEKTECNRAILMPSNSLDAWQAHHRGLWHMYRFNQGDNAQAQHFFELAVRLDPTFACAYAGLSFTHFQNAFQGWVARETAIDRSFETASLSLLADERNPASHWAMGRALWLRGQHEKSVLELEQAIDLSPSFALGHYTLAFVHSQAGDPQTAISASDHSRLLSPFDPLLFGMLGARAIALVRLGQFHEAATWAVKAAARPNAHPHILGLAAFSLALAGSMDEAQTHADALHRLLPKYNISDFLEAFRLDPQGAECFRQGAQQLGMD